jgi:uncharacterized protein
MTEAFDSYDRPFHQRGSEMVVGPLTPVDIAEMLHLDAATAFDATLITGGLPWVCAEWPVGASVWTFLKRALDDPISALLVSAERSLAAEFPPRAMGREVLGAIGSGERTFSNIARAAGGVAHSTLSRATDVVEGGVDAVEDPGEVGARERDHDTAWCGVTLSACAQTFLLEPNEWPSGSPLRDLGSPRLSGTRIGKEDR